MFRLNKKLIFTFAVAFIFTGCVEKISKKPKKLNKEAEKEVRKEISQKEELEELIQSESLPDFKLQEFSIDEREGDFAKGTRYLQSIGPTKNNVEKALTARNFFAVYKDDGWEVVYETGWNKRIPCGDFDQLGFPDEFRKFSDCENNE